MKKITAILVCLLLVASLAVTAFADEAVTFTLAASKTNVSRGDVIDFTVTMSELADCKSGGFALNVDENVFEFVDGSGVCHVQGTAMDSCQVVAGKISGSFVIKVGTATVSGKIFSFQLKVKADAALADSAIEIQGAARNSAGDVAVTNNTVNMTVACAHDWSDWTTTETEHSRTCSKCGAVDAAPHAAVEAQSNTTSHWEECACGYHMNEAPHAYSEWATDAKNHWHVCACGFVADKAKHKFGEAVVVLEPTETTTGLKTYTCETCAYVKEVTIPKIGNSNTGDTMIVAFVALMILSATGIAVTVLGKKRAA